MFENISFLGYALMCLLIVLLISLFLSLVAAYRGRNAPRPRSGTDIVRQAGFAAKRPWAEEDEALHELSKRVEELKHGDEQNPPPPPGDAG